MIDVETPHGRAVVHLHAVDRPRGAVVLGHGAGGGVAAPDLAAATEGANEAGSRSGSSSSRTASPAGARGARAPARRGVDGGSRPPEGERAEATAARRRRTVAGRTRGLQDGGGDRRRRCDLPRVPATASASRCASSEPLARARGGTGSSAGRPGRARPIRDASAFRHAHRGAGRGRPRTEEGSPGRGGRRSRLASDDEFGGVTES